VRSLSRRALLRGGRLLGDRVGRPAARDLARRGDLDDLELLEAVHGGHELRLAHLELVAQLAGVDGLAVAADGLRDGGDVVGVDVARGGEEAPQPEVLGAPQQQRPGRLAVAPAAPALLQVAVDGVRDVEVDDEPHVGLVDAHAEGDRRHDDPQLAVHERLLHAVALALGQPGVVGGGPGSSSATSSACCGRAVDDARVPSIAATARPARRAWRARRHVAHGEVDVRPVEALHDSSGSCIRRRRLISSRTAGRRSR
jgi:hypothetical protein